MGIGKRIRRGTTPRGALARLLATACLGALLGWVLLPSGAGGQQYPLPTPTAPPAVPPAAPPPPPPTSAGPLPLMAPFPIIRIVGRTTPRGAKVSVMTVRAAVGSYVVSRCVGSKGRCPYKQRASRIPGNLGRIRTIHVPGFERSFRAGVVLRIYVVDTGRTGKFTSFKIVRRHAPRRNDGCVADIALRPVTCPTA
jgi:hypothetical protein